MRIGVSVTLPGLKPWASLKNFGKFSLFWVVALAGCLHHKGFSHTRTLSLTRILSQRERGMMCCVGKNRRESASRMNYKKQ